MKTAQTRTATGRIVTAPGKAAHLVTTGRHAGSAVTACNGRSIGFALPAGTEKLCRTCDAGLRSGRIAVTDDLAAELVLATLSR